MKKPSNLLDYLDPWANRDFKLFVLGMPVLFVLLAGLCWLAPVSIFPQLKGMHLAFLWALVLHVSTSVFTVGILGLLKQVVTAIVNLKKSHVKA